MNTITLQQQTFTQWLAQCLRGLADSVDRSAPPTVGELRTAELRAAEVALLAAENEHERAAHTCAMLTERIQRLRTAG